MPILVNEAGAAVKAGGVVATGVRLEFADGATVKSVAEADVAGTGAVVDALTAVQARLLCACVSH